MNESRWIIAIILSYLSGSVPYALLIGKAKGTDIRTHGSGNVGASNCGRVLGTRHGILCFILDVLKGLVPVVGAGWCSGLLGRGDLQATQAGWWLGVAAAAVLGHVAPVWLRFRGGKGVATGFGVILGIWPYLTLPAAAAGLTWLLLASTFRYISLASVLTATALPLYFVLAAAAADWPLRRYWPLLATTAAMALLIAFRHRSNLRRLVGGVEPQLGR